MSLHFCHLNVRSLLNHFNDFKTYVLTADYDIVGVTETWLQNYVNDDAVKIENYTFIRLDRPGRGGGIGMYIKNNIQFNILYSEYSEFVEHMWIKIEISNKVYVFAVVYRPPNTNFDSFLSVFEDTLTEIYSNFDYIICTGDFNTNLFNLECSRADNLSSVCETYNLKQIINEPTRLTDTSLTLLDLIFVSNEIPVVDFGVIDCGISDHFLVFGKIEITVSAKVGKTFKYRAFKNINLDNFQNDLVTIPWDVIYELTSIDDKVEFLANNLLELFDIHAPMKTYNIKSKRSYAPWITENIKLMQNLRENALKKYKSTKKSQHWEYYKQLRNFTTSAIRSEKKAYLKNKFENSTIKQKWKELEKVNLSKKRNVSIPENLKDVNRINNFFVNAANPNLSPDDELKNFYLNNTKHNFEIPFSFEVITENVVLNIIQNIKSEAYGPDKLNITMIFLCCPFIIPYVTHIVNQCITTSYFPKAWKKANVIPLPKINQPTELSHLRSISILPTFSKILEKIMDMQIRPFLERYKILPIKQSGFRHGYSCTSALTDITDDILKGLNDNKVTALILLDYSKAFDMINHTILLARLHYIGFSSNSCKLLKSYITDRYQRVTIDTQVSNSLVISSGVPQGSILGPLLYTLYTACFHESLAFCDYHMYADDTQIYKSFERNDALNSNNLINKDLDSLLKISNDHLLKINPSKSSVILFTSNIDRNAIINNLEFRIGRDIIPFKDHTKNLGLILDYKLRFKEHITQLLKKCYTSLKIIYSLRSYLTYDIKKMLCDSLILSQFNYCDSVYGPCLDSVDIRRIQKVQNSCLRLIFGIKRGKRITHKLKDIGWLNMYDRRKLHMSCFFYKILKQKQPTYLYNKIKFRTDIHNRNIRKKALLDIPRHRKEVFKRSFSYRIATCINECKIIDFQQTYESFKRSVRNKLLLH